MIYKQSSIDIIGDEVKAMTFPITIKTYVNNGGGLHTLTVCNMYHAQPKKKVSIGGKTYTIKSITPSVHPSCEPGTEDVFTVQGDAANITATTFDLYKPHFFHGTPIAQGTELKQKNKSVDKTPMVWFYEQFTDKFFEDPMVTPEREIRFRLFFLTQAEPDRWLTDTAYHNAIMPMRRLAENFIAQLKIKQYRFDEKMEYEILNYAKFGVFISDRGMDKKLWHDNLSGCEIAFSPLTVFKKDVCEDC